MFAERPRSERETICRFREPANDSCDHRMNMPRTSEQAIDELLVLAAQDGDAQAFDALLRRFGPRLIRHAWRLTGRSDAAEDVAQDAWLAIVRGLHRLHDPASFRGWALRIVTHKAADWIRKRQRDRMLKKSLENREPHGPPGDFSGDAAGHSPDATARLRSAIEQLPAELRAVVGLHYREGLSLAEAAHVLDIPTGTVKSRLHAARSRLKQMMERNEP